MSKPSDPTPKPYTLQTERHATTGRRRYRVVGPNRPRANTTTGRIRWSNSYGLYRSKRRATARARRLNRRLNRLIGWEATAMICNGSNCDTEIAWLTNTTTGRRAPIELHPADNGNIAANFDDGSYTVLAGLLLEAARTEHQILYLNHFATCPDNNSFR